MGYIFRTLNFFNFETYNQKKGIKAQVQISNGILKDALTTINSHLVAGSNKASCWLSCSKDFIIDVEEYALPQNGFNSERAKIAVIKEHDKTCINYINEQGHLKNYNINKLYELKTTDVKKIHNTKITDVKKIVYDLTCRKEGKWLGNNGYILKKNGEPCSHNVLALSYAQKNKEVIIFREIPQNDIVTILNPLAIDLLYAIAKVKKDDLFSDLLKFFIDSGGEFINYHIKEDYKQLYEDLYIANQNMHQLVLDLYKLNPKLDVLAAYYYFKELKRKMIQDILKKVVETNFPNYCCDFKINIVEDTLDVIRIGQHDQKISVYIEYKKNFIQIKPLEFHNSIGTYKNAKRIVLSVDYKGLFKKGLLNDNQVFWENDGKIIKKQVDNAVNSKPLNDKNNIQLIQKTIFFNE